MRPFLTFLAVLCCLASLTAQSAAPNFWTPVALDAVALPESAQRPFEPLAYSAFRLDYAGLVAHLAKAPIEFTDAAAQRNFTLEMPQADGSVETFALWRTEMMMPGLAAARPEIRTYAGESLDSPGKKIHFTVSPYLGFDALVRLADKGIEYIEPLATGQNDYYMAYDRHNYPQGMGVQQPAKYLPPSPAELAETRPTVAPVVPRGGGKEFSGTPAKLRIYRFACTTTGKFGEDYITKEATLAKVVSTTNKLNAIYEADLAVRLKLIDEEEKLIFINSATDPFTGPTAADWLNQNTQVIINAIGQLSKFDIGHCFARYISGDAAGIAGGDCCSNNKGRGVSTGNLPYGDDFFSVVGQEVGHMWAGGHSWNLCEAIGGRSPGSACEPGSGSTIMGYSGVCGGDNVINARGDLYYQACSIIEIRNFVETGFGSTCGTVEETGNQNPVVTLNYPDNFFIPISTPFELKGSATDPDGDALTYCWDEIDLGPPTPLGTAIGNSPLFRSYKPTTLPNRIFPKLQNVLLNTTDIREILPTYNRDLKFCLVARDNRTGGGGIGFDTVSFRSTTDAGPFRVSSPNSSSDIWYGNEYRTITWDVANTNKAPVNCQKVNILLSTDNGNTYEFTLATGVPNTGRYCAKIPDIDDNLCRIKVEAADNIFFDVSNAAFKIKHPLTAGFGLCAAQTFEQICLPETFTVDISTSSILAFNGPVTLTATGVPTGAMATFSPNPVQPGSNSTLTIAFPAGMSEGNYSVTVSGTATGAAAASSVIDFTIVSNNFSSLALQTPANGTTGTQQSPTLTFSTAADAQQYEIQVATSPTFSAGTVKSSSSTLTVGTYTVPVVLDKATVYYWRVRPVNECGLGPWTEPFVFGTAVEACNTFSANDLPKPISSTGTPTVESVITVGAGGNASDVNVKLVQGNHAFFKDLEISLVGPDGTTVALAKDKCGSYNGQFKFGFDDASIIAFGCPPSTGATFKPSAALSGFIGKPITGPWTLRVKDNVVSSGGNLAGFQLELCSSTALNAPFIVKNDALQLSSGTNAPIPNTLLKAEDANNSAAQLTYTLATVPQKGELRLNGSGTAAQVGTQFTQADLDNGALRYFDYGTSSSEQFRFVVTDGEGGFVVGTFVIKPLVGIFEPKQQLAFDIAPNPATESLRLSFGESLDSEARVSLFNTAGQQLRHLTLPSGTLSHLLNVADLPDGVYLVTVQNERASGIRKVVVRH